MTAREGCGGVIQHSCMPLKSHSQNNQNNRFVRLQVCVCLHVLGTGKWVEYKGT